MVCVSFKQLPKTHRVSVVAASVLLCALMVLPSENVEASRSTTHSLILDSGIRYPLDINLASSTSLALPNPIEENWTTYTVKKGDTLAKLFKRAGLTAKDTYRVTHAGDAADTLVSLLPGDKLAIKKNDEGQFEGLKYQLSTSETLVIAKNSDGELTTSIETKDIESRLRFAQGTIKSSFWNAGVAAKLNDNQIMSLAGIFGWDIDFAMEIRKGDTFNVIFEELYIEGEFIGFGNIVAAEFVNQNETFRAIRYADGNYYTPEGRSMRKSFLRAPVNFKYVSSNFTKARFHPVQKRWKPHNGTDYVAAIGTPIMAAGDGKVIKASYNRFNGNYVFIQHGEKYVTKYLHLKKRAVKQGETVKQGKTIGYLGSTGMVTAAHLHYEFLVDGVHRNPRTVDLPKARPIASSERDSFFKLAEVRLDQLATTNRLLIAMQK